MSHLDQWADDGGPAEQDEEICDVVPSDVLSGEVVSEAIVVITLRDNAGDVDVRIEANPPIPMGGAGPMTFAQQMAMAMMNYATSMGDTEVLDIKRHEPD